MTSMVSKNKVQGVRIRKMRSSGIMSIEDNLMLRMMMLSRVH